jgi:peptide/nickel transport system substrate-binding protein
VIHPATRTRSRLAALLTSASVILSLAAGCAAGGASDEVEARVKSAQPVDGGSLIFISQNESNGLDPIRLVAGARSGDSAQAAAIFDVLMYIDPATHEVVPKVAESFTSDDDKVWDLKIREGVTFSDGTPYDAEAVKFNWERIADPANGAYLAPGMGPVAALKVVGSLTLRITLKSAYPMFPRLVVRYLSYVGSPTAIEKLGDGFAQAPVGAGPFTVESWARDSELRLVKNPNYWQKGLPHLDKLTIRQVPDDEQRFNAFTSGAAQIADAGTNTRYAARAHDQGYDVLESKTGGGLAILFNTKVPPFDDVEVRRAVAQAIDLKQLHQVVNGGTNAAPRTMFPESNPFHAPDITFPAFDKQAAQKAFDDYAAKNGGPLKIKLLAATTMATEFEMIQGQLSEYDHVEAELTTVQNTALVPMVAAGDFQMANYAITGDDFEPTMYAQLHTGGERNYGGLSDAALDRALEAGRSTDEPSKRVAAYRTAQERIADLVPAIFNQEYRINYLLQGNVGGMSLLDTGPMWEKVWLHA